MLLKCYTILRYRNWYSGFWCNGGNLIEIHNAAMTAAGKLDKLMPKDYMYVRNIIKILRIQVKNHNNYRSMLILETTGLMAQSGQMPAFTLHR